MTVSCDPQPKTMILPQVTERLAAHLFARWWLGLGATSVELVDEPASIGRIEGSVMFHSPTITLTYAHPVHRRVFHAQGVTRAKQMLFVLAVGSAAAAGIAGVGNGPEAASDGRDAVRTAARVAQWTGGDPGREWKAAVAMAHALLAVPRVGSVIGEISDTLLDEWRMSFVEIAQICSSWFDGRAPFYDCWSEAWPPTPQQLRAAYVPVYRDDEAAVAAMVARSRAAIRLSPPPGTADMRPQGPFTTA